MPPGQNLSAADLAARIVCAGFLTGLLDGAFSSVLSVAFYHSSIERLFQGVASVLLGPAALRGGTRTAMIGVAMHFGVAFAWSIVFILGVKQIPWVRSQLESNYGIPKVAAWYGPAVWMAMSLAVIPLFTHRPPSITGRWWTQFFGHMVFVGLPIVYCACRRLF